MASFVDTVSECGSRRSLGCFSVDESVLHILWDEDVSMEELLDFSYDHIDDLAAKHRTTVGPMEKDRLWDYIQTMKVEQPDWITTADLADVPLGPPEESLRARSVSDLCRDADALFSVGTPEALSALSSSSHGSACGPLTVPLSRVLTATLGSYPATPLPARKRKGWRRLFNVSSPKNAPVARRPFVRDVPSTSTPLRKRNLAPSPQHERKEPSGPGLPGFFRRSLSRLMISSKTAKSACPASQ